MHNSNKCPDLKNHHLHMAESKHTPTPWKIAAQINGVEIMANDTSICEMSEGYWQEEKADAEFIVRAVNSYEALIEAARHFKECRENIDTCDQCYRSSKAIALCEEK